MDPSAARYLEALTAEVTAVLGGRLVGVYAHGSLLLGGYLPTRSDIDVLVVVEDPLTPEEQADLAARLSEDALPCPAVGLELSVVLRSVAAAPTARPAFELHVTTAPADRKVVDGHGHPGDLDLVLHFAICPATHTNRGLEATIRMTLPVDWRWRWDLNPRWACTHTRFRGVLLRPLGHATAGEVTGRARTARNR